MMLPDSLMISSSEAIPMVIRVISFIFTHLSLNSLQTLLVNFVTLSTNYHCLIQIYSIDVLLQSALLNFRHMAVTCTLANFA